ncbi:TlpA family protein disulfide reductase [Psychroflexus sp. ALD_RP9]|uniref:TlpA family protein disulfide reductase n=1 Tax=Psychroflexus sp. ALD_RP9 TaxID=2777186 RepID=UPI001A8F06A4|nr:hypothetical protein [Psychroflexus sp. ALD_RP9]QSS96203.1 hypothetical protein IMZ30_06975 [Psychroflexus sp. ALD_RP9]
MILLSLLCAAISVLSGALGWTIQFIVVGLVHYSTALLFFNPKKAKFKLFLIAVPFTLIYISAFLSAKEFRDTMHIFPILIIPLFSIAFALILNKRYYFVLALAYLILSFVFIENWLKASLDDSYLMVDRIPVEQLNLNSIGGRVFEFHPDTTYVVDLWNSACKVCIEKFPQFEALAQDYSHKKDLVFMSLNIPLKRDKQFNVKSLVRQYQFQSVFSKNYNLGKLLNIKSFPKLMIVKNKDSIVFKGSQINASHIFVNNINTYLKSM